MIYKIGKTNDPEQQFKKFAEKRNNWQRLNWNINLQCVQNKLSRTTICNVVHMEGQFETYAKFANKSILYDNLQTMFQNKNLQHLHIMIRKGIIQQTNL